ncbi:MAG: hypothetical protein ABIP39_10935 [Polyangiaceae bacterium]
MRTLTLTLVLTGLFFAGIVSATPDAGAPKAPIKGGISKIPPDPSPMFERGQWIFDLRYQTGDIYLLGVHRIELGAPQATPRVMGRFAVELFEGPTLVERVRFDFPGLIAGDLPEADAGRGPHVAPFDKKLTTRIGVMFPATSRGTRLELWDRATDRRYPLAWPPAETHVTKAIDGG